MDYTKKIQIAVWIAVPVTSLILIGCIANLLVGWPVVCSAQATVLGVAASSAGALAMFLTAWFALRQLELQSEQLAYYYRPGLWLRIDYAPDQDESYMQGLPIRI